MWRDVRHGWRFLLRQRGFSILAVLTLALGTGASAAIFSVIDAALLHPLPYPNPEQLVRISVTRGETLGLAPSLDDVRAWSTPESPVATVAIERTVYPDRVFDAGTPERVVSMNVSSAYFPLYGVAPVAGRLFTEADMQSGAPVTIILSHGFWLSRFGGDPNVINRAVRFDGGPATIVGVLPPRFGRAVPIWRALQVPPERSNRRGSGWTVVARLKNGLTRDAAATGLLAGIPHGTGSGLASAIRLRSELDDTRSDFRTTVTVLSGAVGFIVLIGCVNVAGLLLARGAVRETELAVRASIGAGRGRLLRQLLTESLMLSTIGGLVGLLLAWLALDVVVASIPIDLPADAPARLNGFVMAATASTVLVTAVLFGIVPAFRLSQVSLARIASGARHAGTSLSRRGGQSIIGVEVALAVIMVAGAALMTKSLSQLLAVDLGFDPDRYLTLKAEPLDPQARRDYYPALLQQLRQLPDVEFAGAADYAPLADGISFGAFHQGTGREQMVSVQMTLPGYFEALGLPLKSGRTFTEHDRTASGAIVISEGAARLFFPDRMAIGQRLERVMAQPQSYEVIGVVGDARHFGPAGHSDPAVYGILPQVDSTPPQPLTVVVRPRPGAKQLPDRLRNVAEAVGSKVIVDGVKRGSDWLDSRVAVTRHRTALLGLLGGLGLLLALIGVFGMTSYAVARRTREIGIRVALGAHRRAVVGAVLRDTLMPIGLGVAAGIGGALYATAAINPFLFKTSPTDPATLMMVAALMLMVGCLAAWLPARRAARIDPIVALRE